MNKTKREQQKYIYCRHLGSNRGLQFPQGTYIVILGLGNVLGLKRLKTYRLMQYAQN